MNNMIIVLLLLLPFEHLFANKCNQIFRQPVSDEQYRQLVIIKQKIKSKEVTDNLKSILKNDFVSKKKLLQELYGFDELRFSQIEMHIKQGKESEIKSLQERATENKKSTSFLEYSIAKSILKNDGKNILEPNFHFIAIEKRDLIAILDKDTVRVLRMHDLEQVFSFEVGTHGLKTVNDLKGSPEGDYLFVLGEAIAETSEKYQIIRLNLSSGLVDGKIQSPAGKYISQIFGFDSKMNQIIVGSGLSYFRFGIKNLDYIENSEFSYALSESSNISGIIVEYANHKQINVIDPITQKKTLVTNIQNDESDVVKTVGQRGVSISFSQAGVVKVIDVDSQKIVSINLDLKKFTLYKVSNNISLGKIILLLSENQKPSLDWYEFDISTQIIKRFNPKDSNSLKLGFLSASNFMVQKLDYQTAQIFSLNGEFVGTFIGELKWSDFDNRFLKHVDSKNKQIYFHISSGQLTVFQRVQ